eukprot:160480_1
MILKHWRMRIVEFYRVTIASRVLFTVNMSEHWRWIYVSNIGNRDRSVMICGGWGQRMRLKKQIGAIQNRENELESEIWRQTTSDKCMRETDLIENKSNLSEPDEATINRNDVNIK